MFIVIFMYFYIRIRIHKNKNGHSHVVKIFFGDDRRSEILEVIKLCVEEAEKLWSVRKILEEQ